MTVGTLVALVVVLAACWVAAWRSALAVFRQKLRPEFEPLPGLVRAHVTWGVAWEAALALTLVLALVRARELRLGWSPGAVAGTALALAAPLVAWTGHGLLAGKPRGAWVHAFYGLVASGALLVLASEHLRDLLP